MCLFNIQNQALSVSGHLDVEELMKDVGTDRIHNNDHQLFAIFKEKPLFIYSNPKFKLL